MAESDVVGIQPGRSVEFLYTQRAGLHERVPPIVYIIHRIDSDEKSVVRNVSGGQGSGTEYPKRIRDSILALHTLQSQTFLSPFLNRGENIERRNENNHGRDADNYVVKHSCRILCLQMLTLFYIILFHTISVCYVSINT